MLQDLDQLAARIGVLAQRARQLHAERDALRARLSDIDAARHAQQLRIAEQEAELAELRASVAGQSQAVDNARADAEKTVVFLREQLSNETASRVALEARCAARENALTASLQSCETEFARLRAVTADARERIGAVLSRLPGAATTEEET